MEIRELQEEDWPAVREIFEQGIAGKNATFETEAPSWEAWDRSQLESHRYVAVEQGRVGGWVAGPTGSGRSRRASSRRTRRASLCTRSAGSASWARRNGSESWTASGGTSSSW